jgi:hypothetical protein
MSTTTEAVKPSPAYGAPRKLGDTARRDRWWVQPFAVVTALSLFGLYTILRVILSTKYPGISTDGAHLQSPMFSPNLDGYFGWGTTTVPWSLLVLWAPLGMRTTCYYYRKSIYRSYFLSPPSCAVAGAARRKYDGETKFPFVVMNLHRFFFYAAAIVVGFLTYDFFRGLFYTTSSGGTAFGISVGSGIMLINIVCLSAYTFGCNSWRHIVGGKLNCFDCSAAAKTRHGLWKKVTKLNVKHQQWAWISMFTVWATDLYIWLAGSGVFTDPHHIF